MGRLTTSKLNESGQTSLEYLLLMAVVFIASFIMIRGPLGTFSSGFVEQIRADLRNVIRNAERTGGPVVEPGQNGHPGDPNRLKAVHL